MEYQQLSIFIFLEMLKAQNPTRTVRAKQLWIIYDAFYYPQSPLHCSTLKEHGCSVIDLQKSQS